MIVGVGRGLGMALARRFAQEGFRLALLARSREKIEDFAADLALEGYEAHGFPVDAADPQAVAATFADIKTHLGIPEVLIYNVYVPRQELPSQVDVENLVADFRINVAGALACAQQVIEPLREKDRSGTIIFTGGGLALYPRAAHASVAASKAALRSLAYSLAQELEPDDIHVATVTIGGSIEPGTHFDPDKIAETYWQVHTQPKDEWQTEFDYFHP